MSIKFEQETIFNFNEAEATATIYTHNTALKTKLDKLCKQFPSEIKLIKKYTKNGRETAREYELPKKLITVRTPKNITAEEKELLANRMREYHKNQKMRAETPVFISAVE